LLGRGRYLALLLMATVAGNLLYAAASPLSHTPVIGASGGIGGVILYYGLVFPRGRLRMRFYAFFELSVWAALVLWLVVQFVGMLVEASQATKVAYAAHVGGALAGLIFWSVNGLVSPRLLSVEATARR